MYNNAPESGLASLLASRGRNGDSVLVHMTPGEVQGLQGLAMAHGGSLTINPKTGLYEASFLKKVLPHILGAVIPSVPGLGNFAKTIGFGSEALGSALLVGGATGLIEGDLKKGLQAGLGAYSGANIASGLRAASVAGGGTPEAPTSVVGTAPATADTRFAQEGSAIPFYSSKTSDSGSMFDDMVSKTKDLSLPIPRTVTPAPALPTSSTPSLWQGAKNLFTTKEGMPAFMNAMGGGFESPLLQKASQYATFAGAMMPLAEEAKPFPMGGEEGSGLYYIRGQRNPQYGSSRDQPYYLPGRWVQRTPQGVKPWRGYAGGGVINQRPALPYSREAYPHTNERYPLADVMQTSYSPNAPRGQEVFGGFGARINPFTGEEKFAEGGEVGVSAPKSPFAAQQYVDPNVLATRQYIEELNARAKNPVPGPGMGDAASGGLGRFKVPFTPYVAPGGGGGDVGGGGGGVADLAGAIATNYLIDKGIGKGFGYLKDKFTTGPEDLQEVEVTGQRRLTEVEPTTPGIKDPLITAGLASIPSFDPTSLPTPSVSIEELPNDPYAPESRPDYKPPSSNATNLASAASAGAGVSSLIPRAGRVLVDGFSIADDVAGLGNLSGSVNSVADLTAIPSINTGTQAGLGSLMQNKILPGVGTVLGAYETGKAIEQGKEGRAAFNAAMTAASAGKLFGIGALGGPAGMLTAAAIAAIGASLVNTEEMGANDLKSYWKGVDQAAQNNATYFGTSDPSVLSRGFINLFRTDKFNFPGQEKYGRTGNEDFMYDMTRVINDAVKSGKVDKTADANTIYNDVVQPWLNSMGSGTQDPKTQAVVDYMMTDLVHNFMYGQPISNAQVKGDNKYKIVSERPVYAGTPAELGKYSFYNQIVSAPELTSGGNRINSFGIGESPGAAHRAAQLQQTAGPPPTPFSEPRELAPVPTPYSPRIIEEEPTAPMPPAQSKVGTPPAIFAPPAPVEEEPVYIPRPQVEEAPVYAPPAYTPPMVYESPYAPPSPVYDTTPYIPPVEEDFPVYGRPVPVEEEQPYIPRRREMEFMSPFSELSDEPQYAFAGGGAIGEDYNFGFAGGGMPGEYAAGGKLLNGPGDGMSDNIPAVIRGKGVQRAALADGEFVIPADVVSHLGNGSTKAGAQKLYDMMNKVRQARTGRTKQAPAVKADRFLPV
jgi:hypothetical protein